MENSRFVDELSNFIGQTVTISTASVEQERACCRINGLGSVVDIPVDKIASFVHNAVGSGL